MQLVRVLCPKCSWVACEKWQILSPTNNVQALTASCRFWSGAARSSWESADVN